MRRTALMRRAGPYVVESFSDGRLLIKPSWPDSPVYPDGGGGGPGLFSRMGLAFDIESYLNAPYAQIIKDTGAVQE